MCLRYYYQADPLVLVDPLDLEILQNLANLLDLVNPLDLEVLK